jgi:ComF family protein
MNKIQEYYIDFINLFYPNTCSACGNTLIKQEEIICTTCLYNLPKTKYWLEKDNPISKIFWGRVQIENACSYYFFSKGSIFRDLIHKLKYNGAKEIGSCMGKYFGYVLADSPLYSDIDIIIPVPLHPKKEKKRGYNQSDWIAMGLSEGMKKEWNGKLLFRKVATETQTKKSKFERWQNVENIFNIKNPKKLIGKHILLVDDVITTGSTIEACANSILSIENTKVSIVALACATN